MQSAWRVACVRIPRFPIGAVWRAARRGTLPETESALAQLQLPLTHEELETEIPRGKDESSPENDGARNLSLVVSGKPPARSTPHRSSQGLAGTGLQPAPGHWDDHPIALVAKRRLRAVSAAAGSARVRAGMTVAEARALCAGLELLDWDDVIIAREITETTAALLEVSPQVTPVAGAPGMWWIGAHGFEGLGGERALLHSLRRIARRWHPRSRVAIADSCVAARAATWNGGSGAGAGVGAGSWHDPNSPSRFPELCIVPPGGCAAFLATAPLALIPMDEELREALTALGLGTAGAFAALSAEDVERRWGEVGLAAWRLARGEDRRRPVLTRIEARRSVSAELSMPAATMEPVLFLIRAALDRLVAELVRDGRGAAAIAITLTLDEPTSTLPSGGVPHTITREVRLARPLARVPPLLERCRALLEGWTLTAPVCAVTVTVVATMPLTGEQGDLLDTSWHDPAALDAALARLRAELGPNVVVRPIARDEHRPERAGGWAHSEATTRGRGQGRSQGQGGQGGQDRPESCGSAESSERAARSAQPEARSSDHESLLPPGVHTRVGEARSAQPGAYPDHEARATAPGARRPTSATRGAGGRMELRRASARGASAKERERERREGAEDGDTRRRMHAPAAAIRLLETPEAVELEWRDAVPCAVWWRGDRMAVARAIGPERLSGDWWKDGYSRDYWRCESELGELLVYRDLRDGEKGEGQWYLQAWYD